MLTAAANPVCASVAIPREREIAPRVCVILLFGRSATFDCAPVKTRETVLRTTSEETLFVRNASPDAVRAATV